MLINAIHFETIKITLQQTDFSIQIICITAAEINFHSTVSSIFVRK